MKYSRSILTTLLLASLAALPAAGNTTLISTVLLEEKFDAPLSKDWFWGLGTWAAKGGVLRGFESGPRRHGPVKMRKFPQQGTMLECDFRFTGKASFAGIIFNGAQERGHIVHLVMGRDQLRILAHPKMGASVELLKISHPLEVDVWHRVQIEFKGPVLIATVNGKGFRGEAPAIAEEKLTFGLDGDSGGPEGEKAGVLEFRKLKISSKP